MVLSKARRVVGAVGLGALLLLAAPSEAAGQFDAGIAVGTKAPVVSIPDLDGKLVDLGAFFGKKPVLLEFWATWCAVCKALLPQINKVHQQFGDRVAIVGVNITVNESKERVRRYLAQHRPPFVALYDDQGVSARAFEVPTTGFIVLVDAKGVVRYTGSGEDQDLVAEVAKLVGK
ncbi:MAG: TlpA family protein disulfide reductase [Gemmatimonadales bacterium]